MRIIVDFHAAEDDRIWALRSHVRDELFLDDLGPGALVLLDDTDGHTASGVVQSIDDNGLMEIVVIWQTWRDGSVYSAEWLNFTGVTIPSLERAESRTNALQLVP